MFGLEEQKTTHQRFDELTEQMHDLDQKLNAFFQEMGVTPDQIHTFIHEKENFSVENWETLQKERQKLELQLKRELENLPNVRGKERAWKEREVAPNWLFVK